VLGYPKFDLSDNEIRSIVEDELLPYFTVIEIEEEVSGICRDANDDMFLAAAVNAKASFIVTGDKDLLELENFRSIRIVTAHEYLDIMKP